MLIVWFVVLIVFSVLFGKLSEVPDSSKVSITSTHVGPSWHLLDWGSRSNSSSRTA
jgi:hypothetical protein